MTYHPQQHRPYKLAVCCPRLTSIFANVALFVEHLLNLNEPALGRVETPKVMDPRECLPRMTANAHAPS